MRRRRAPSSGDAVGLLDQRDGESGQARCVRRGGQVTRTDAATCAVAEDDRPARVGNGRDVRDRRPVRRLDGELGQAR
jgi:hypothetical protein